jgi:iron only hydrogenase large subunit-like protein
MACPSGCVNGGGQIKSTTKDLTSQRKLVQDVKNTYMNGISTFAPVPNSNFDEMVEEQKNLGDSNTIRILGENIWINKWSVTNSVDTSTKDILHTTFTAMDKKEANPLTMRW